MPCHDPQVGIDAEVNRNRANYLTQLLCKTCQQLQDSGTPFPSDELHIWWRNHQEHDKRVAAAKKKREAYGPQSLTGEEIGLLWNEPI